MLKGKRIAGIDFGTKRVGVSVSDELHITATPKAVLDYQAPDFWNKLNELFLNERVKAAVVGMPYRSNDENKELIDKITYFADFIKTNFSIPVYFYDEAYSSRNANKLMFEIGMRKKQRQTKGNTDKFASAIILKEFLVSLK